MVLHLQSLIGVCSMPPKSAKRAAKDVIEVDSAEERSASTGRRQRRVKRLARRRQATQTRQIQPRPGPEDRHLHAIRFLVGSRMPTTVCRRLSIYRSNLIGGSHFGQGCRGNRGLYGRQNRGHALGGMIRGLRTDRRESKQPQKAK